MPFEIIRNDITKMAVDAIVNSAHVTPDVGGGVDAAIHLAAGPELLEAYRFHGPIGRGTAFLSPGFGLPAKHVIHTVGPIWEGGHQGETKILRSCYESCLRIAEEQGFESVAFPLISAGGFGFPREEALTVAVAAISAFVLKVDMTVYLVVFDHESFVVSEKLMSKVFSYIMTADVNRQMEETRHLYRNDNHRLPERQYQVVEARKAIPPRSIKDLNVGLDETFSDTLFRLIDGRGKNDVDVYKKANIDRKHFAKIRADRYYQPKKSTVFAFAFGLELNVDETKDLLLRAGYAISHSFAFYVLFESYLKNQNYDIFELNEVLFHLDLPIVGSY